VGYAAVSVDGVIITVRVHFLLGLQYVPWSNRMKIPNTGSSCNREIVKTAA